MAPGLLVCTGVSCEGKGSRALLRDLEDLCLETCEVTATNCLGHCGKGPNVEVRQDGKQKVVEGVETFKALEKLAKSEAGVELKKPQRQICELKYEARRSKTAEERLAKLEKAFKALGGEEKAAAQEPKLTGQLLVMRAREVIAANPQAAEEDARKATELLPKVAAPQLVLAAAMEKLGRWDDGLQALQAAQGVGKGLDLREFTGLQRRLQGKVKEQEAAKAAAEAEAQRKRAEAEEAEQKSKAEAEAKRKKSQDAKRREEAKRKAETERLAAEEAQRRAAAEEAQRRREEERLEAEARVAAEAEAAAAEEAREAEAQAQARQRAREEQREALEARHRAEEEEARQQAEEEQRRARVERLAREAAERRAAAEARRREEESCRGRLLACCRPSSSVANDGDAEAPVRYVDG